MLAVTERCTAAHNQVRRLPVHGTAASHYAARRLAETLSGSVKGPKRVPLSFRKSLSPQSQYLRRWGGQDQPRAGRPQRSGRTATGAKTGLSVALAVRKVRQGRIWGQKRGNSWTSQWLKHTMWPQRALRRGWVCFNGGWGGWLKHSGRPLRPLRRGWVCFNAARGGESGNPEPGSIKTPGEH